MSGENKELTEYVNNVMESGYSQPILYLKKSPTADTIVNLIHDNCNILLHNAPICASNTLNNELRNLISNNDDKEFVNTLSEALKRSKYSLDTNQILIAIEQFTNYIVQNTLIAFCSMLDYTGNIFRGIINYLPVKSYVSESLNDGDIREFLTAYMFNAGKTSFGWLFNLNNSSAKEFEFDSATVRNYNMIQRNQLTQIIYTKLCKACDKAITEALLGTRVTPNKTYIIDAGCKYYGIKNTGIETAHEIYYRLNIDFVNLIDKLMGAVIVQMCDSLFNDNLFTSLFYIFQMGLENINDNNYKSIIDEDNKK